MLRRYFKQRHLLAELLILAALIGWALFFYCSVAADPRAAANAFRAERPA